MKLIPAEYLIRNTVDSKPESGARSVVNEIRVHSEWFGRVQEVNMDFRVQEIGSSIKESSVQWLFFSLLYILCAPCSLISCASLRAFEYEFIVLTQPPASYLTEDLFIHKK